MSLTRCSRLTHGVILNKRFLMRILPILSLCGLVLGLFSPALSLADALEVWSPKLSFDDEQTGKLKVRFHPLSPRSCGIDIIEVGTELPSGRFDAQIALLRDRYDETYPGISPKIRRVFSYNLGPLRIFSNTSALEQDRMKISLSTSAEQPPAELDFSPSLPPEILNLDTVKGHMVGKLLYEIARSAAISFGNIYTGLAAVTIDQFVDAYLHKRQYHRTRALYTLQLLDEGAYPDLKQFLDPTELRRAIAVGTEFNPKGLLITQRYQDFVYSSQMDTRRENRVRNFANLLSAVNREGFIAQPLFRDFVMVYFDPSRDRARASEMIYTDIDMAPENALLRKQSRLTRDGLLPVGIYAIGKSSDRLLNLDFLEKGRVRHRKYVQILTEIAVQTGVVFVPFPFSMMLRASREGATLVLNKEGTHLLTSVLDTEAELAALLDSGVAQFDESLLSEIRSDLETQKVNLFLAMEQKAEFNRVQNAAAMTDFLARGSTELCEEIAEQRNSEFTSEYLSVTERFTNSLSRFWNMITFTSNPKNESRERTRIIVERSPLIEARDMIHDFDAVARPFDPEHLMTSLALLGKTKEASDAALIGKMLRMHTDPTVIRSTLTAALENKHPRLVDPLVEFLATFDLAAKLDVRTLDLARQAILALGSLNYLNGQNQTYNFATVQTTLRSLNTKPNPLSTDIEHVLREINRLKRKWEFIRPKSQRS